MKAIGTKYKREILVFLATVILGVVFTALNPNFLMWRTMLTIFQQMVLNGLLAVGIMFAILTGGIDLSIGCTFAIVGIAVANCCVKGMNPFLAILAGLLVGGVLGVVNRFFISAHCIQIISGSCFGQNDMGNDKDRNHHNDIIADSAGKLPVENIPKAVRHIGHRRAAGYHIGNAPVQAHGAQSGDKWLQLQIRNQKSVKHPQDNPHQQSCQYKMLPKPNTLLIL